jgi:hypothetical protein
MDERIKFVARLLDGENMSAVCREFGISRKTGYKIFNRYKDFGLAVLQDRTRRPHRYAMPGAILPGSEFHKLLIYVKSHQLYTYIINRLKVTMIFRILIFRNGIKRQGIPKNQDLDRQRIRSIGRRNYEKANSTMHYFADQ